MSGIGISGWPSAGGVGSSRDDRAERSGSTSFAKLLSALGGGQATTGETTATPEETTGLADSVAGPDPQLLADYEQNLGLLRERIEQILDQLELYAEGSLEIQEGISQNLIVSGTDPERGELETAINNDLALRQLFRTVKEQAQKLDQSLGATDDLAGLTPVTSGALPKRFQLVINQRQIQAVVN